jgi:hypothetical protein
LGVSGKVRIPTEEYLQREENSLESSIEGPAGDDYGPALQLQLDTTRAARLAREAVQLLREIDHSDICEWDRKRRWLLERVEGK